MFTSLDFFCFVFCIKAKNEKEIKAKNEKEEKKKLKQKRCLSAPFLLILNKRLIPNPLWRLIAHSFSPVLLIV